jgi:outer membrane protein OmpA-like peptidoglycan-associated protein
MAWAVVAALTAPAAAQDRTPAYTAQDFIRILKPAPAPLGVARGIGSDVRSLAPATGPKGDAGAVGSGVVPDLKILFPFNSTELTEDARRRLDELGRALASDELAGFRFELAGHTDAIGSDRYNAGLSARRAQAVAGYLAARFGIDPERLAAKGYGKHKLIDPAAPDSPRNRRVEVVTLQ